MSEVKTAPTLVSDKNPKGIRPYSARDDCFLKFGHSVEEHGESARKCEELVRQHRACMEKLGFQV
ncbi:hypothetical protein MSPP1_003606 [Malassezia sp. CBS 17886]|nr:hypothetical protein MSPP1_003606 [Malassezia sp. CBS 17886]